MAAFPALKETEEKLAAKQAELAKIFDEAGPELDMDLVKSLDGDSAAKVDAIRALNEELDELGRKREKLQVVAKAAERAKNTPQQREPGADDEHTATRGTGERKSLGELFTESVAYKGRQGSTGPEAHLDLELKALFETATGWGPESIRSGRVVDYATAVPQVIDLIPQTTTSQSSVVFMEETTFDNTAAEIAEGGPYPEAELGLTEQTSPVRKIGVWLPVTDEQLEDVPQAQGYINNRLPFMIRQRLGGQILVGNGTAPNLRGFLNTPGLQTQAKGTDPTPDAVYKAMTKVQVAGMAMPNAVVFHPTDWQDVRLLRTADGVYIWGSPSDAGPARIWGLPVTLESGLTENTALVGDFANFSELAVRRGMDIQVTNSHADFFTSGKQAIRADIRAALVVYRPSAFCSVTGV